MAGIVNRPKKTGERLLLRPSEGAQWEVWAAEGAQARLIGTCDTPAAAGASPQSVLALPLRQVFAVPLWLATSDPALMREMIFLQLERRGLSAGHSAREMIFDYRVVASVENKTLVLAVAVPATLPAHLCLDVRASEPSARLLPLPPDEFTLWREDGRLALAVTRGGELAYFQALGDGSFTPAAVRELQCVKLQLEAANVIARARGVTLWGDFAPGEVSAVGEALGLRVAAAPRPAPALPRDWMDLAPASVRQGRKVAQTRSRTFAIASAAAAVYLLFLLVLVARLTWFYIEAGRIEAGLQAGSGEVAGIKATAERWNALAPAVDPASYPVELLYRTRPSPDEGVRFTAFSTGVGTITIQGEAASPTAATRFVARLTKSGDLRSYKFEMPTQPVTPINANTTFEIEGVQYGARTH